MVAHPLSKGDSDCRYADPGFHSCSVRSNTACAASLRAVAHASRAALRLGTAAVVEDQPAWIALLCGFGRNTWVCELLSTRDGVNIRRVSSCGFGGAASLSLFQLWVQEGTTQTILTKALPGSVAKSFLHKGDVIVRRQDTSRTRIQVVEPFVGHMRVAQAFDARNLLPRSFREERVLQAPESSPIRQP